MKGTVSMWKLIFITSFLFVSSAWADNTYYEFGPGIANQTQQSYSDVKLGEIGRVHEGQTFVFHYGIGGWQDSSHWPGARSTLFPVAMLGWEPQFKYFYVNYSIGPTFLSKTDTVEGGNFQVAQEFGFGVKDTRNVRVGFAVRHFSDADIKEPNYGRNFLVIRVQN